MKKSALKGIGLLAILLAVFSVIAFILPFVQNTVFWIAYGCGAFAILFQLYLFKTSFGAPDTRSKFYGFPIARLGICYLIIQLILSIAEMALAKHLPTVVVILLNMLLLAAVLIGCITTQTMRDQIAEQDSRLKKSVSNMRDLQSLTAALADQSGDPELQKILKKAAEEFRYSDPLSSEKTMELENDMRIRIGDLQQAVTDGDVEGAKKLCQKLTEILKERNRICSLNK